MALHHQVKVIGNNGQVSLGKEFAGKMVLIDQINEGTWIIKSGAFMPDTEKWLHQEPHRQKLDQALKWAEKNEPVDNFDELAKNIAHD
jgi:hypothetical protein